MKLTLVFFGARAKNEIVLRLEQSHRSTHLILWKAKVFQIMTIDDDVNRKSHISVVTYHIAAYK